MSSLRHLVCSGLVVVVWAEARGRALVEVRSAVHLVCTRIRTKQCYTVYHGHRYHTLRRALKCEMVSGQHLEDRSKCTTFDILVVLTARGVTAMARAQALKVREHRRSTANTCIFPHSN